MKINGNLIFADDGMMLTEGNNYGSTISLAEDRKPDEYTEITIEEYEERMGKKENNDSTV